MLMCILLDKEQKNMAFLFLNWNMTPNINERKKTIFLCSEMFLNNNIMLNDWHVNVGF